MFMSNEDGPGRECVIFFFLQDLKVNIDSLQLMSFFVLTVSDENLVL